MTEDQTRIFAQIQAEKAKPAPDRHKLARLARALTSFDDVADVVSEEGPPTRPRAELRAPVLVYGVKGCVTGVQKIALHHR